MCWGNMYMWRMGLIERRGRRRWKNGSWMRAAEVGSRVELKLRRMSKGSALPRDMGSRPAATKQLHFHLMSNSGFWNRSGQRREQFS